MRYYLSVLSFLLLVAINTLFAWEVDWENPLPHGNPIFSVDFADSQHGIAVGSWGNIIYTEDGGITWTSRPDITFAESLEDVSMVTPEIGYTVGRFDILARTEDGGQSWLHINPPEHTDWLSVQFLTSDFGWISGEGGNIFETTDGGESWRELDLNGYTITHFEFRNENAGFALAGIDGRFFYTINGRDWEEMTIGINPTTWFWTDFAVVNDNTLLFSSFLVQGNDAIVRRTTDAGQTWGDIRLPDVSDVIAAIHYIPQTSTLLAVGYLNDWVQIFRSEDWGLTWTPIEGFHSETYLYKITQKDDLIWVCGDGGTVAKSDDFGQTWTTQTHGTRFHLHEIVECNDQGWAVGTNEARNEHIILHTNSIDEPWTIQKSYIDSRPEIVGIRGIDFVEGCTGWAVGDSIWKTTDSGETWINQLEDEVRLLKIDMVDDQYGWAVGRMPDALKTSNGGEIWEHVSLPISYHTFNDVCFISPSMGWIAAGNGELIKTTDGGETWTFQTFTTQLGTIQFINANIGWAAHQGRSGVYRTENGGTTWRYVALPEPSGGVWDVQFIDSQRGWAGSNLWRLFQTFNGGLSWEEIDLFLVYRNLADLYVVNDREVWVCGPLGSILRYNNYGPTAVETSDPQPLTPKSYVLHQNYPNPFNPTTTIRFDLPHADQISLNVYDLSGKLVQNLVDHQPYPAGTHQIEWDASDLPSGVYIYQLETLNSELETLNSKLKAQKAVVLK